MCITNKNAYLFNKYIIDPIFFCLSGKRVLYAWVLKLHCLVISLFYFYIVLKNFLR